MDWADIQKTYIIPWQRKWHAVLDRELGNDVDFDWRDSLGDMGLIFDLSSLHGTYPRVL